MGTSRQRDRDGGGPERLTGIHPVREALRAGRRKLHRLLVREGRGARALGELRRLAEAAGVAVVEVPAASSELASGPGEREAGFVLEAGPLPVLSVEALLEGAGAEPCLVALDGVEDPQNLGSILRVAEAAGAAGALLTLRRAAPLSPAVSRASAGALEHLPVARVTNLVRALKELKEKGFWVMGADQQAPETLFVTPDRWFRGPLVVLLGAEGRGIRPGVAKMVDHRVKIPMAGRIESLNVATAAAVVLYEVRRRRG